eukprot:tig00000802_g4285.t1
MASPDAKGQAAKTQKYDRQLRLWGEHGQAALENAKICLINCGATGSEILKNLVLPGIGSFTIIDGGKVEGKDLGSNFFVDAKSVGQSRAKCVTELLKELNEYVQGSYIEEDPVRLIAENPSIFDGFTFVIATQLPEAPLLALATHLYPRNIPLLAARSYGMLGYIRLVVPEHRVVESRPEVVIEDLRVTSPFPGLVEYAKRFDLAGLDSRQHSHVPYIVILMKLLDKWKAEHEGKLPSNRKEKDAFKAAVQAAARSSHEENFHEAAKAANKHLNPYSIPSEVRKVLEDECARTLTKDSPAFWILADAVREFVANEGEGRLPLMGSLPDMTATTESYIELQRVFQEKAAKDVAAVQARLQATLSRLGRPADTVSAEEAKAFCRNAPYIRLLRYRSLEAEHALPAGSFDQLGLYTDLPGHNGHLYVLLRAVDRFYTQHGRYPGQLEGDLESETGLFRSALNATAARLGVPPSSTLDDYALETVRFGASELHCVAAVLGGIASQEAIKVVTRQFTPMNNTLLYNGVTGGATVLEI